MCVKHRVVRALTDYPDAKRQPGFLVDEYLDPVHRRRRGRRGELQSQGVPPGDPVSADSGQLAGFSLGQQSAGEGVGQQVGR